jgi:ACS family tartrate transporter-like MFS transporter
VQLKSHQSGSSKHLTLVTRESDEEIAQRRTIRKVTYRIVPFLMLCYFVAFVDRVNVGFAALQMNRDLGLTASAFGLGGGLFYISYILLEVPSNIAMEKVGARVWIARIMITWGLVSACTAFITGPRSFYASRLLLGAAEAGFFPGVILYLTYWFPARYRARIIAIFMVAIPVSSFVGSPISAALLQTDGLFGLRGWQWLFILEAVPAIVLGFIAWFALPDRPSKARWLTSDERRWLSAVLEHESRARRGSTGNKLRLAAILRNPYVLGLALAYAGASGASQCLSLWQPQIIKSFGLSDMETGLLNALPFGVASVSMVIWGLRSDRSGERIWHTVLPLFMLAAALFATLATHSLAVTMIVLCVAVTGTYACKGPFWALSTEWLSAHASAAGIAQINAIGLVGGFIGTYLLGVIRETGGSYPMGLQPLTLLSVFGCAALLILARLMAGRQVQDQDWRESFAVPSTSAAHPIKPFQAIDDESGS